MMESDARVARAPAQAAARSSLPRVVDGWSENIAPEGIVRQERRRTRDFPAPNQRSQHAIEPRRRAREGPRRVPARGSRRHASGYTRPNVIAAPNPHPTEIERFMTGRTPSARDSDPAPPGPAPPRRHAWIRWLLGILVGLVGMVVLVFVLLGRPPIATRFTNTVLARVVPPGSRVRIERVSGDWITRLELSGVRVTRGDTLVLAVDTLRAHYRTSALIAGRIHVRDLDLAGLYVAPLPGAPDTTGPRTPAPTLADWLKGRFYAGAPMRADRVTIRGARYVADPNAPDSGLVIERLDARISDLLVGGGFSFTLDTLSLRARPAGPASPPIDVGLAARLHDGRLEARALSIRGSKSDLTGRALVAFDRRDSLSELSLALAAHPLALADLRIFVAGVDLDGTIDADVDVRGPRPDRVSGTASATSEGVRIGALALGPTRLSARLTDGRADASLSARYEGANAAIDGWVRPLDSLPTYDVEARVDRLPERIAAVAWWPDFARRAASSVTLHARGSSFAHPVLDATGVVDGAAGRVDLDGGLDLSHGVAWQARRIVFTDLDVSRLAGDTIACDLDGTITASGRIEGDVQRLTAALTLDPSQYGDRRIAGARARASMNGATLGASLAIDTDAGRLEVDSLVARWDAAGTFRVSGARFEGVDLERLTRQPALASRLDGTLSARGRGLTRLGAPGGPMAALRSGRVSGQADLEVRPSIFRGQAIARGAARATLAGGAIDVTSDLESSAGRIDLVAHARPFDAPASYDVRELRFARLDLGALTGAPSLASSLSGTLTAAGHPAAGPGTGAAWTSTLRLDSSSLGPTRLDGGVAHASLFENQARLDATISSAGDTLALRSEVAIGDSVPRGHAELSIPLGLLAALAGRDSLPSRGGLETRVEFAGLAPADARVDGSITGRGAVGPARLDSLAARFALRNGTLTLDTLAAISNVGTLTGRGHVAIFDSTVSSDLHAALVVVDVAPLRPLVAADTLASAGATLDLRLTGPAAARHFDTRAALRSLVWDDLRIFRLDGAAQGDFDRAWRLSRANADLALSRARVAGIDLDQAQGRAAFAEGRTALDVTASIDEQHRVHAAGDVVADSAAVRVSLATLDLRADSVAWALERPALVEISASRLSVDGFELDSPGGRITAHGVVDRRGDQDFRLDLENVGLGFLSALIGRENVSGLLNGGFAIEGPSKAPRGSGRLALDLAVDRKPAGTLRSNLAWDGTRLDLGGGFASADGDSLVWNGHLPLAISIAEADSGKARMRLFEGAVDVRVRAHRFPLRSLSPFLDPRSVGDLDGTLDVDASLVGTSRALEGRGSLAVSGGVVPLPALGATYSGIELRSAMQGDRLVVQSAHATSKKGALDASGEIRFVALDRIEPRLHVIAKRFTFVQTKDLRAIASGEVDLTGTVTSPVAKGKVTIENSSFNLTPAEATVAEGDSVRLSDADIRMMEEVFGPVQPPAPNLGLVLYDASDLDLAITLERNNWVRQSVQPNLAVTFTGDFRLKKAPHQEPEMFGRIEPIANRGYVEQFARSFDITGGEVLLNGKMQDHRIDLQAQYKPPTTSESGESETTVNLDVTGTPVDLKLKLSSDPPMSDAEIVSFIATGKDATSKSSTSSSSSNESLAKDIGMSTLSGGAEQAAQQAIGLDVLQVRFDALTGATLVAGRYVDPKLYLGFRQPLQYKDTGSSNSGATNRTGFELEYAIQRWLVFNLQGETSKLRSFIRARHAY